MNKNWFWSIIPVAVVGYFAWRVATAPVMSDEDVRRQELAGCVQHGSTGMHVHPELTIIMRGEKLEIPANIGIEGGCMHPIHTHDNSGTLHLEFKKPRDVRLGEFFEIWGKPLTSFGTPKMKVNGQEKENTELGNYIMHDHDQIEITFE